MSSTNIPSSNRIESIDLLRGIVMIIMALDHVRDYFHADAFVFDPTDLSQTSVPLFFTRWITHYCAPVFIFLAGTSAFLVGNRKGKKELSIFLLKRGLWLVFLELVVVNFAWFFNLHFSVFLLGVIWVIGISMILLAAFIHLPWKLILLTGILLVAGHNLFDSFHVEGNNIPAFLWSFLHTFSFFQVGSTLIAVAYPLLAWLGVMLLGYCFGTLYQPGYDALQRKKILRYMGLTAITLFVVIRSINLYGDPHHWSSQATPVFTMLSFLNVTKYPPSLLYVFMTLGPAILFLSLAEGSVAKISRPLVTVGRVPMFYYLLHIYLIHILAVIAVVATGFSASSMFLSTWVTMTPELKGYGFNLWVVYGVWLFVVLLLFPLCKWYESYRRNHPEKWWLSYL